MTNTTIKPRVTSRAEDTRRKIYEAAMELFREKGFEETTMRDIAGKAGVALGGAYYYYSSKDAIVLAFYREMQETSTPLVGGALTDKKKLKERIRAVLDQRLKLLAPNRKFCAALFRHAPDGADPLSPFSEESRLIRDAAIEQMRVAIEGGDVKIPADLKATASLFALAIPDGADHVLALRPLAGSAADAAVDGEKSGAVGESAADFFVALDEASAENGAGIGGGGEWVERPPAAQAANLCGRRTARLKPRPLKARSELSRNYGNSITPCCAEDGRDDSTALSMTRHWARLKETGVYRWRTRRPPEGQSQLRVRSVTRGSTLRSFCLTGDIGFALSRDILGARILSVRQWRFFLMTSIIRIKLRKALLGTSTLINTYWIRFPRGELTFETAVRNTRTLIEAAKDAGVGRIVHVSIANPSAESPLGYYRGKAELEQAVIDSGLSYTIVRPTVIFGDEDILINNIAWFVRRFPVFGIPGDGRYRIRPIYVEDMARIMADAVDATWECGDRCGGPGNLHVRGVGQADRTLDWTVGALRPCAGEFGISCDSGGGMVGRGRGAHMGGVSRSDGQPAGARRAGFGIDSIERMAGCAQGVGWDAVRLRGCPALRRGELERRGRKHP